MNLWILWPKKKRGICQTRDRHIPTSHLLVCAFMCMWWLDMPSSGLFTSRFSIKNIYVIIMCMVNVYMCALAWCMCEFQCHSLHVEVWDNFVVLVLFSHPQIPEIKLGSQGWEDKCLYPVSNLTSLRSFYFLTHPFTEPGAHWFAQTDNPKMAQDLSVSTSPAPGLQAGLCRWPLLFPLLLVFGPQVLELFHPWVASPHPTASSLSLLPLAVCKWENTACSGFSFNMVGGCMLWWVFFVCVFYNAASKLEAHALLTSLWDYTANEVNF